MLSSFQPVFVPVSLFGGAIKGSVLPKTLTLCSVSLKSLSISVTVSEASYSCLFSIVSDEWQLFLDNLLKGKGYKAIALMTTASPQ